MEFLVEIALELPSDLPDDERRRLLRAEAERARVLAREGVLRRLWRVPGRSASWGIWEAPDATALHDALTSLPLWPWLRIEVHPLARHPNDPGSMDLP